MMRFRSKLRTARAAQVLLRPTSLEEMPVEIIERIAGFLDFNDRLSFRETSTRFRTIQDRQIEHRVKKLIRSIETNGDCSRNPFLATFCRLIYETTIILHRISFPQFIVAFLCDDDLRRDLHLHSSVVNKISHAKSIGDVSDVFEKMMLKYLTVVRSGCKSQRNKFRFLLILTIMKLLNVRIDYCD